jgi:hypothetical protein
MKNSVFTLSLAAGALGLAIPFAPSRGADQVPNISGFWQHTVAQEEWENPPSGPGPVRRMNGAAESEEAARGNVWMGDYHNPILQPWAAEAVKKEGEHEAAGGLAMTGQLTCQPSGVPAIFTVLSPIQILQAKDKVAFLYQRDHMVRVVPLNREHRKNITPSYFGDSVGHYEGDTLVVDTIGIAVKPLSTVDRYGTPHTPALHLVERYRLIDPNSTKLEARENSIGFRGVGNDVIDRTYKGKALQIAITVEDPGTFTTPWSGIVVARRTKAPLLEDICADQIHDYITGKDTPVPQAKTDSITGE